MGHRTAATALFRHPHFCIVVVVTVVFYGVRLDDCRRECLREKGFQGGMI